MSVLIIEVNKNFPDTFLNEIKIMYDELDNLHIQKKIKGYESIDSSQNLDLLKRAINNNNTFLLVARVKKGEVFSVNAGFVIGEVIGDELKIHAIYVSPRYRTSGIGKKFLKELQLIAIEKKCKYLVSNIYDFNIESIKLHKSFGFNEFQVILDEHRAIYKKVLDPKELLTPSGESILDAFGLFKRKHDTQKLNTRHSHADFYMSKYLFDRFIKDIKGRYYPFFEAYNDFIRKDKFLKNNKKLFDALKYNHWAVEEAINDYLKYEESEKIFDLGFSLVKRDLFNMKFPKGYGPRSLYTDETPEITELTKEYDSAYARVNIWVRDYWNEKIGEKYDIYFTTEDDGDWDDGFIDLIPKGKFMIVPEEDSRINISLAKKIAKESIELYEKDMKLSAEAANGIKVANGKYTIELDINNDPQLIKVIEENIKFFELIDEFNTQLFIDKINNCKNAQECKELLGSLFDCMSTKFAPKGEPDILKIRDIVLKNNLIPMERFYLPHKYISPDGKRVVSRCELMMIPAYVRGLRQMSFKEGRSVLDTSITNQTGQATGDSRAGIYADTELVSSLLQGQDKIIKEFMGPASNNTKAYQYLQSQIRETGKAYMKDMPDKFKDKKTIKYLYNYGIFAGLLLDLEDGINIDDFE